MLEVHEGGCICGALRYCVKGDPLRGTCATAPFANGALGSAFGMLVRFEEENVELMGDPLMSG